VAFRVGAGVPARPIEMSFDLKNDFCAGITCPGVMRIDVIYDEVATLRFSAADFIRLLHKVVHLEAPNCAEHYDGISAR
jgi:hypothetical protein